MFLYLTCYLHYKRTVKEEGGILRGDFKDWEHLAGKTCMKNQNSRNREKPRNTHRIGKWNDRHDRRDVRTNRTFKIDFPTIMAVGKQVGETEVPEDVSPEKIVVPTVSCSWLSIKLKGTTYKMGTKQCSHSQCTFSFWSSSYSCGQSGNSTGKRIGPSYC